MFMRPVLMTAAILTMGLVHPAAPARAQDYKTVIDLPAGQTLVNLSATERVEVDQDLLMANLRYEEQGDDATKLQDKINGLMKKALDTAKKYPAVKVATQQYYVYPYDYDPNPRRNGGTPPGELVRTWRGSQGLEIKGTDAEAVLELTGELQAMGLAVNGLSYTLSPEKIEETQDSLLEAALEKLKAKADRTAKALGKSSAELRTVNVDIGGNFYPQPMMMARGMAMDGAMEKMSAPVAQAGQSEISMTVSASALLK